MAINTSNDDGIVLTCGMDKQLKLTNINTCSNIHRYSNLYFILIQIYSLLFVKFYMPKSNLELYVQFRQSVVLLRWLGEWANLYF